MSHVRCGRPRKTRAFTLLEAMVVLLIFSVVSAAIFMVMSSGRSSWYSSDAQIELQQELRKAMRQITTDLRQSSITRTYIVYTSPSSNTPFPDDSLAYNNIICFQSQGVDGSGNVIWSANPIEFTLSGDQILRNDGSATRVVANKITQLTFVREPLTQTMIRINMTAQKTTPRNETLVASLNSAVLLRN